MGDMVYTIHLCLTCRSTVRTPGAMGRSWCPECQEYNYTATVTHVRQR